MKRLINVNNKNDNECFRWCHLAHKFPVRKNAQRTSKYVGRISELNYDRIDFPVALKDYNTIEKACVRPPILIRLFVSAFTMVVFVVS